VDLNLGYRTADDAPEIGWCAIRTLMRAAARRIGGPANHRANLQAILRAIPHAIFHAILAVGLGAMLSMAHDGAAAAGAIVLGDSQGAGLALAAGIKGLAHNSVHIRGPRAIEQINATPTGTTAFLVLGSNDAEFSIAGLDKSIDDIVQAAAARGITLVWIGPPCVRKAWNARSRALDQMLERRFAQGPVKYVSMWDDTICSFTFHEPDGVHLTMKGYAYVWKKASAAAGFTLASAEPPAAAAVARASAERSVERSTQRSEQRSEFLHKPHRKRVRHVAVAAPARPAEPIYFGRQRGGE
jgi:hypothetical protein